MTIQIEKGVPMPETRGPRTYGAYREVMAAMEVGDSFVAEGEKMPTLQSAVRQAARRAKINITVRREGEESVKLRVWRVADAKAAT
jgi:hypothetical protein